MRIILSTLLLTIPAFLAGTETFTLEIPQGINLSRDQVLPYLSGKIFPKKENETIEIIIYYYSRGIEELSYNDDKRIEQHRRKGEIKALIKIKRDGKLINARFVASSGKELKDLLEDLTKKIAAAIRGM